MGPEFVSGSMKLGIPRETFAGEARVAATPSTVGRLRALGLEVQVQAGAGADAGFSDAAYQEAGAQLVPTAAELLGSSDIVLKVRPPGVLAEAGTHETDLLKEGACLVSFVWPAQNKDLLERLGARKITVLAMDCVPRISRAQKMDALSAMANVAGYRAVIEAAAHFGRFIPAQMTAAGRCKPARVFVVGAGVAGLAAIAAARALGAEVSAIDTRREVNRTSRCRVGHRHHHRAHPRQARAPAHHLGRRGGHAGRLRDRRSCRGAGRKLRAHRAR
jgi:NAD(P) transhydrogenase subunit alpha